MTIAVEATRPFHESIIEVLVFANGSQLTILADLIKRTAIPKNHDAIIAAWTRRTLDMHSPDYGVSEYLQRQKEQAAFTARITTGC
ncbi:hypothetical protein A3E97_03470 [Candidatus Uhrbacteria bacterium RIFCSPHIGHO2_12_FULL_47_12]|nr:MAG: hypothetical protein A3E97_03470 [Candidatus Uhrbacteria bacterium RIFCSPHIGHO2_12_FULL_47_12]